MQVTWSTIRLERVRLRTGKSVAKPASTQCEQLELTVRPIGKRLNLSRHRCSSAQCLLQVTLKYIVLASESAGCIVLQVLQPVTGPAWSHQLGQNSVTLRYAFVLWPSETPRFTYEIIMLTMLRRFSSSVTDGNSYSLRRHLVDRYGWRHLAPHYHRASATETAIC